MKLLKGIQLLSLCSILFVAGCKKDKEPTPVTPGPTGQVPTVIATSPNDMATNVSHNKVISFTFSEEMDSASIVSANVFTVKQGSTSVAGSVVYLGTTASFTPTAPLLATTPYTATISTGAKSKNDVSLAANKVITFTTGGASSTSGLAAINLGASGTYVILAESAITNVQNSSISGDVGINPKFLSDMTGFSPTLAGTYATSTQVVGGGKIYSADMGTTTEAALIAATSDKLAAYNDGATRPLPDFTELHAGAFGGKTLVPGLYKYGTSVTAATNFTITGGANDVYIFQIAGDLIISTDVKVTLSGGVQAKNIFWVVAGQTTLEARSQFKGIILCATAINFRRAATLNGRALAQTQVVLDQNTLVKPL